MKYILKSGTLFSEKSDQPLVWIKSMFLGPNKMIYSNKGELILQTTILESGVTTKKSYDVRSHKYVIKDMYEREIAAAYPNYDSQNDPEIVGWPVCHVPHVNLAKIFLENTEYDLIRKDSQTYQLSDVTQKTVIHIRHRGISGGWNIHAENHFSPQILCGIFIFCKYIEQENEFLLI